MLLEDISLRLSAKTRISLYIRSICIYVCVATVLATARLVLCTTQQQYIMYATPLDAFGKAGLSMRTMPCLKLHVVHTTAVSASHILKTGSRVLSDC